MRLMKNKKIYLIIIAASILAAVPVQATDVIEGWVTHYNGPGNSDDGAYSIAVDSSDNIYVTGYSFGSSTGYDYATVKYDSAGNELWVRRYNGPGNGSDYAYAIAVDGLGNIYVTGSSTGSGTGADYATVKYDSNGNEKWVARYNGPGNSTDIAHALALDDLGNIYITGGSFGSGTGADYTTVKYDSNGNEKWVARYNGPGNSGDVANAISIDGLGNIYVTGGSGGSGTGSDYATIKYNTSGTELWVRRYNNSSNDYAYAIAVDSSGNIYVTGSSGDYVTIKYDTDGNQKWAAIYNGPGNSTDVAYAIAVDGSGNIYVTGSSVGSSTGSDYATIKYDTAGNQKWVRRYNGPGNSNDGADALSIDDSGNIYISGSSTGSATGYDLATIKYDSGGNQLWAFRYNGPGYGDDYGYAIAIDGSNNIYVTGQSMASDLQGDYVTIQYNQNPPVILTMQTEPSDVNTVTPSVGGHPYAPGVTANISAQRFVNCPYVYVFDHWVGDVNNPNSAQTTIFMDADKTVTAVFVDGRRCGDECHPYPEGDFNRDCKVDFGDFALFVNHWLECTKPQCD